jgi:CheY-like chemotaxis protein
VATLLIVEDEPAIRNLLDDFFTGEGFNTLLAATGLSAVTLACATRPDLILMDMMLPGMDGVAATRTLRTNPDTRSIPIVAMSASTSVLTRDRALLPVDDRIAKPFDLDELLRVVSERLLSAHGVAV